MNRANPSYCNFSHRGSLQLADIGLPLWCAGIGKLQPRLMAVLEERIDALQPTIRDRVSEGVREGINAGVVDVRKTIAQSAARGGLDVLEERLNQWFRRGHSSE